MAMEIAEEVVGLPTVILQQTEPPRFIPAHPGISDGSHEYSCGLHGYLQVSKFAGCRPVYDDDVCTRHHDEHPSNLLTWQLTGLPRRPGASLLVLKSSFSMEATWIPEAQPHFMI